MRQAAGPLPISTYMRTCLLDPSQGYYAAGGVEGREVLGARGDFITSPEISQVFGEVSTAQLQKIQAWALSDSLLRF